jgi:hypothetical protein
MGMELSSPGKEMMPQTKKMSEDFLRVYEETCDVDLSAKLVGANPKVIYQWRRWYPEWDARFREVQMRLVARLENTAFKLALAGDSAMIRFLLQMRLRSVYHSQAVTEVKHEGNVEFRVAGISRQEAAVELAKRILESAGSDEVAAGAAGVADSTN